ncbi:MAG: hypothetical protein RL414_912 [Actinomycetota bacterium]
MKRLLLSIRHKIAPVGIFLLASGAIFLGIQQLASIGSPGDNSLPDLRQHADIPLQTRLTFDESLSQQFPDDAPDAMGSTGKITSSCSAQSRGWLNQENQGLGVAMNPEQWHNLHLFMPHGSALWTNKMSATCGETIDVHASLVGNKKRIDQSPRTIEVLRVGYYFGSGARLVWSSVPISLKKYPMPKARTANRMVETNWPTIAQFTIGADWTPGLYMVVSTNSNGQYENFAPLIVRAPTGTSKLLLVHSTITWAAYNNFGGRSSYKGPGNPVKERSRVISMDRPIIGSGINHVNRDAVALIQFLEEKGIEVDQIADTDVDRYPSLVKSYSGIILSGHPEYMTNRIFRTLMAARNNGINLALLGSNAAYWQVRLESSPTGQDRRIAIYKNALTDPVTSPSQVSIQFNNSRINLMPSLITGQTTAGVHVKGAMKLISKPRWLDIPNDAVLQNWPKNTEIDSVVRGKFAPKNIKVIFSGKFELTKMGHSPLQAKYEVLMSRSYLGQTAWFATPSGSAVFIAGVNYWACELNFSCMESTVDEGTRTTLQSVTQQVLTLWQTKAIGKRIA